MSLLLLFNGGGGGGPSTVFAAVAFDASGSLTVAEPTVETFAAFSVSATAGASASATVTRFAAFSVTGAASLHVPTPRAVGLASTYRVASVERGGTVRTFVPNGIITEDPGWEMSTFGAFTFTNPLYDRANSRLGKYDEVVVVKDNRIVWWGVIVTVTTTINGDDAVRTYRCADLLWYFDHRYVGKASRFNYARNPSFEAGSADTSWGSVGTIVFDNFSSDRYKLDDHSGKITAATADQDWYVYEDILAFTSTGVGDLLTIVGWYFIEDDGSFVGTALDGIGLALIPFDGATPEPQETGFARVNGGEDNPVRGSWQKLRATIYLPPDTTRDLQIRLYAQGGTIYWDAIQVVRMESLSSVSSATDFTSDIAKILQLLVLHAQDPAVDKDDVAIEATDISCPDTGVRKERHYQYADHAQILRAMQEFPAMEPGCDFYIDWTRNGPCDYTRTFRTAYPNRGTDRGFDYGLRLVVGPGGVNGERVVAYGHTDDGDQGITSSTVLGEGDGPDREEAGVLLPAPPLIVEEVIAAPVTTDIDALAGVAAQNLAARDDPDIWQVTVHAPTWVGVVLPGDTLPAHFVIQDEDGATIESFSDRVRVASCSASIDAEQLALTLNRVS